MKMKNDKVRLKHKSTPLKKERADSLGFLIINFLSSRMTRKMLKPCKNLKFSFSSLFLLQHGLNTKA